MSVIKPKGLKMYEVVKIMLPEFTGGYGGRVDLPISCAIDKRDHLKKTEDTIVKMDKEIANLETRLVKISDKTCADYGVCAKRLARCREIKKACEHSVVLTTMQLNIEKCKASVVR